ncbi:uncharacterized protein METZ01_LOCUS408950, partial [marine metagenome]
MKLIVHNIMLEQIYHKLFYYAFSLIILRQSR